MVDRTFIRQGVGLLPPTFMRPGELGFSPADDQLWIADAAGVPHKTAGGSGTVVTPPAVPPRLLDSFSGVLTDSFASHIVQSS